MGTFCPKGLEAIGGPVELRPKVTHKPLKYLGYIGVKNVVQRQLLPGRPPERQKLPSGHGKRLPGEEVNPRPASRPTIGTVTAATGSTSSRSRAPGLRAAALSAAPEALRFPSRDPHRPGCPHRRRGCLAASRRR